MSERRLGTVSKLWRYPVKSMLGEACERMALEAHGVQGDRLFAIRDAEGKLGRGKTTQRFRHIEGLFAFRAVRDEIRVPRRPAHGVRRSRSRIDERRFRPNIVVEVPGERPVEQDWLGKTLCVGNAVKIRVSDPTKRCQMTTFAQADCRPIRGY